MGMYIIYIYCVHITASTVIVDICDYCSLQVRVERQSYWYRRRMAAKHPDEFMSVIIDGADQSANGLSLCLSAGKYIDTIFFFYTYTIRSIP